MWCSYSWFSPFISVYYIKLWLSFMVSWYVILLHKHWPDWFSILYVMYEDDVTDDSMTMKCVLCNQEALWAENKYSYLNLNHPCNTDTNFVWKALYKYILHYFYYLGLTERLRWLSLQRTYHIHTRIQFISNLLCTSSPLAWRNDFIILYPVFGWLSWISAMTASSSWSLSAEYRSDFLNQQTNKTKILKLILKRQMICYLFINDVYTAVKLCFAIHVIVICYKG